MGQFDSGATSALASGLGLGLHALSLRQQHDLALQHLQLAQQQMQRQVQQHQDQVNYQNSELAIRQQGQDRMDQQATDRQSQQTQEAQGDADLYGSMIAPQAGAAYMGGDHSDESFFDTAQGLTNQRNQVAQASPATRRAMIAQQSGENAKHALTMAKIENVNKAEAQGILHPDRAAKMRLELSTGLKDPADRPHGIKPEDWLDENNDVRNSLPEQTRTILDMAAQNNTLTEPMVMSAVKPAGGQMNHPNLDPDVMKASAAIKASKAQLDASAKAADQAHLALNEFLKSPGVKDTLNAPPDDKTAQTDPAWGRFNAATQKASKLRKALADAIQAHDQATSAHLAAHEQYPAAIDAWHQRSTGGAGQPQQPGAAPAPAPAPAAAPPDASAGTSTTFSTADLERFTNMARKTLGPNATPEEVADQARRLATQPAQTGPGGFYDEEQ